MKARILLAVTALALGGLQLAAAAPAEAGPPPLCLKEYDLAKTANAVQAYGTKSCDDQPPVPLHVGLQRYDPASGAWHLVAEGTGTASFSCFGTGTRKYRHAQAPSLVLTANCT
jgi:hypothetical protein